MNVVIRNAKIIDTSSDFHDKTVDLKICDGIFTEIGANFNNNERFEEINFNNLHISKGWFDTSVSFGEPGFEDRETIENGLLTAAKSGFTGIALQPNSNPILDNQSQINFVKQKAAPFATELFPIGALTKNSAGHELAELIDMKNAGAIAFGDYNKNIENANLLKIALQYTQDFNAIVITFCQDNAIAGKGLVNEGIVSTMLGLSGIPALAEELIVARNLFILEYTGGKMHILTVSTAKSVQLVRKAKEKGLHVTCSVAVHNLVFNDSKIDGFDTRFKVLPPLRTELDRKELIAAVLDNTIDCITSDHNPIDIENKKLEFDKAKYGTIGLESTFGSLQKILPTNVIIQKLTCGRKIFNLPESTINIGQEANITIFNPSETGVFTLQNILSKSKNSAFLNHEIQGKVYGIYNQKKLVLA